MSNEEKVKILCLSRKSSKAAIIIAALQNTFQAFKQKHIPFPTFESFCACISTRWIRCERYNKKKEERKL